MPSPRFEVPTGVVDGANTVFVVSRPYRPGSAAVFLNGLLLEKSLDNGWAETDPGSGTITMNEAPSSDGYLDTVQVFFIDTSPALPESEVFRLKGKISFPGASLKGNISSRDELIGIIATPSGIRGITEESMGVRGVLNQNQRIRAKIKEACS